MSFAIYTTHYSESDYIPVSGFYPIQVGKALTEKQFCAITDATGDNISVKNPEYCELTAQYWVWKNKLKHDYIGFMHYRRHVCFNESINRKKNDWGLIEFDKIDSNYIKECGLDQKTISDALNGFDILVAEEWDVSNAGATSNYDLYLKTDFLHISDYDKAIRIINESYPEFNEAVKKYNNSNKGFYTNIFIMRKEVYEKYSEWLFDILSKLENQLDLSTYSQVEKRVIGHIAERLFGIYLTKVKNDGDFKIKQLKRTIVNNTNCYVNYPEPSFSVNNTPIILNFNDKYSHVGGVLIQSLIECSNSDMNYDIFILENSISEKNKVKLVKLVKSLTNFKISFLDMNKFDVFSKLHTHAHFSKETYYRLYIPKLFFNFERVIYIDADMIVQRDVHELMNIDLEQQPIAAVQCYVMQMMIQDRVLSHIESGCKPADLYVKNYLGLDDPSRYFQAGLLVMDIPQLNKIDFTNKSESLLTDNYYWFLDQDIMNAVINGRVKLIEFNWNTLHGNSTDNQLVKKLPYELRSSYLAACINPYIVHYAGDRKPWLDRHVMFADLWWGFFSRTPWFIDDLLSRFEKLENSNYLYSKSIFIKLRNKLIFIVNKSLPIGTKRRIVSLKFYRRFRAYLS
ncbi:DUF4422 domain-containing protein [Photobacterium sp. MCCC 1A19761]|uniref:DUF4422 domain-containing protein n=1 Tax=Photobacterium sp. MCCC 1A19761 TaxID=3115000 RepID=UPI00307E5EB3